MGRWKKILAFMTSAALAVSGISVSQDVRAEEGMVTDADLSEEEAEGPADWGALPNEEQLHYMKSELSAFCHFGRNGEKTMGQESRPIFFRLQENLTQKGL